MSVSPLFVADMETLKAKLRLAGASSGDSQAIVDDAVEKARIGFYDELGASRIATLLATGYSENPTTEAGVLRAKANATEVAWVRLYLLRTMPSMFVAATGGALTTWNQEGIVQDASKTDLFREIERLKREIAQNLLDLAGESREDGEVQGGIVEADEAPDEPFHTLGEDQEWV